MSIAEAERQTVQDISIGCLVEPEDIADVIVLLVAAPASAIPGT